MNEKVNGDKSETEGEKTKTKKGIILVESDAPSLGWRVTQSQVRNVPLISAKGYRD